MSRNVPKKPDLTPRQIKVIEILLQTPTVARAAEIAGISKKQIFRWLNSPEFSKFYREMRDGLLNHSLTHLQGACPYAVAGLLQLIADKTVPAAVKRAACRDILELSIRSRESLEYEERLKAIETRLDEMPDQQPRMRSI
jgi:hypothetical protein